MKVNVFEEFNVFELFVHDNEVLGSVDPSTMAEALSDQLIDSGWRVRPPENLGRFTLFGENHGDWLTERCFSIDQVKDYFPVDVVELLEEINAMEFNLGSKSNA